MSSPIYGHIHTLNVKSVNQLHEQRVLLMYSIIVINMATYAVLMNALHIIIENTRQKNVHKHSILFSIDTFAADACTFAAVSLPK